ncbi:vesicle transport protein USE1 isoform X2 [Photinus pyralis]|uniref:vesicle transport protein USE1 isoform X2 n=1 Tax=Photinus pyralis TaxID=7054 RepID=UPI00126755EE|nr:vesicle transport protein USE1 isoform X2 [Photinus pyralis]
MALSRNEINLRRLLNKCELMVKSKQKKDERFPQYIQSLEEMWKTLQGTVSSKGDGSVREYYERILNLKIALGLLPEDTFVGKLIDGTEGSKLSPRDELLGLRKREPAKKTSSTNDLDDIIDYHQDMQAKIADEMLTLTKNLKEQSELANKIIKKDTEVVGRSSQLTEDNFTKLKSESNKLTEHSKRAWKCWMWIMLLVVLVVFINMVLFMKVMKKKY